jgi:hypothetical protein
MSVPLPCENHHAFVWMITQRQTLHAIPAVGMRIRKELNIFLNLRWSKRHGEPCSDQGNAKPVSTTHVAGRLSEAASHAWYVWLKLDLTRKG